MNCKYCSRSLPDDAVFCSYCGRKQTAQKTKKRRQKGTGSVRKKGKKYEVRYQGEYLGMIDDPKDALNIIINYINSENTNFSDYTVKQTFEQWVSTPAFRKLSASVQRNYLGIFKNYFQPIYKLKMEDLKTGHLQQLIDIAYEMYSYDVCAKIRTVASGICKQAMKNDVINKNYAQLLDMPEKSAVERTPFSDAELEALWAHKDDFYVKVILILIYTGLRPGELFQTKKDNINLVEQYMITGIKTEAGKNRVVPIADNIKPLLSEVSFRSHQVLMQGICTQDHFGKVQFPEALERCGIHNEKLVPYSCRHTFYNLCKKANVDGALLIKIFGHSNEDVGRDYYFHPDVAEKLNAVNLLIGNN